MAVAAKFADISRISYKVYLVVTTFYSVILDNLCGLPAIIKPDADHLEGIYSLNIACRLPGWIAAV